MLYVLTCLVALYWTWRFLHSAHLHLRPLPEPALETPAYTLLIPEGESPPDLMPLPTTIVHCEDDLPSAGWVLVLGAGLEVDSSLVRRLVACDSDFVSVTPQPNSTLLGQAREKFLRNHVPFGRVNAVTQPIGYGDLGCCWFFVEPTDMRHLRGPLPASIAQTRALQSRPIQARQARTETGDPLVIHAAQSISAPRVFENGRGARFMPSPLLNLGLELWPFLGMFFTELFSPSAMALGLAFSSRVLTVLRDGFGWRLCIWGFIYEPWAYFRDREAFRRLRVELSGFEGVMSPDSSTENYHALTGSRLHVLAQDGPDSWSLEDTILSGKSDGKHRLGLRFDEYLQATPDFCSLRWRMVLARQWLDSVSPDHWLAIPSFGQHLVAEQLSRTVYTLENDLTARQQLKRVYPEVKVLEGDLDHIGDRQFDAIVLIGMAEHMGDSELRRTLTVMRRSLSNKGHLILITLSSPPGSKWATRCIGGALRFRAIEQMRSHLETSGYRILEHELDPHRSQLGILCVPTEPSALV